MKEIRCAIYTRKSSEEGLEQEFNSLHAQREACEAFIKSQQHEGWKVVEAAYDDGGYSGGTLERPALKQLFEDIKTNKIDCIVVYKIDRLTRSLLDFSKIIELLDKHTVSFVSITQQFNTTTSMGRLTLNVLLSFAQFEREVTGERIRDKIAASKKKGMWMGGNVPFGYDLKDRKLIINGTEAQIIENIYSKYIEFKSVHLLKDYLEKEKYRTKTGKSFYKGHLYKLLKNKLYLGEIEHKGNIYKGEHEGIIDIKIFNEAQEHLKENCRIKKHAISRKHPSLLSGKLFDDKGNYMSPSHSQTHKKHYRYYTSQAITQAKYDKMGSVSHIPAQEIEDVIEAEVKEFLSQPQKIQPHLEDLSLQHQTEILKKVKDYSENWDNQSSEARRVLIKSLIHKVIISQEEVSISLYKEQIKPILKFIAFGEVLADFPKVPEDSITIIKNIKLATVKDGSKLIIGSHEKTEPNLQLIKAIARSYSWHEKLLSGEIESIAELQKQEKISSKKYIRRILDLRFLSPKIVSDILNGSQPRELTLGKLLPLCSLNWPEQHSQVF